MSFKKFFTGNPGNLEELIKYSKEKNINELKVVLFTWLEIGQGGHQFIKCKVLFSTDSENFAEKPVNNFGKIKFNIGFTLDLSFDAGFQTPSMESENHKNAGVKAITRMKKIITPHLNRIKEAKLNYDIIELNRSFLEK